MLGVWNRDGEPQWATTLAQAGRNTVVEVHEDTIFAAWIEDDTETESSVWARWWDVDGNPRSVPTRLAPAGRTTWNLNATLGVEVKHVVHHAALVSRDTGGS